MRDECLIRDVRCARDEAADWRCLRLFITHVKDLECNRGTHRNRGLLCVDDWELLQYR